jgi:hypothetical protein
VIKKCSCRNEGQDKLYGTGNRVWNEITHPNKIVELRCTVCGKSEKSSNVKEGK